MQLPDAGFIITLIGGMANSFSTKIGTYYHYSKMDGKINHEKHMQYTKKHPVFRISENKVPLFYFHTAVKTCSPVICTTVSAVIMLPLYSQPVKVLPSF